MRIGLLSKQLATTTGIGRLTQALMVLSILTNFIFGVHAVIQANKSSRETMVPPVIYKTFWVEDQKVSPEYLEQMGLFLMQLALNNTPVNAEYNAKQLLRYAAPASYGELEAALLGNAQRLKRDNASTFFSPRAVTVDGAKNAVSFNGVQTMFIADRRVSEKPANYTVRLGYNAGRVYVYDLRETDPKTPFADLPPPERRESPAEDTAPATAATPVPQAAPVLPAGPAVPASSTAPSGPPA